jgi:hypothetical protein
MILSLQQLGNIIIELKQKVGPLEIKSVNELLEKAMPLIENIHSVIEEYETSSVEEIKMTHIDIKGYGTFSYGVNKLSLIVDQCVEAFIESIKKNPNITLRRLEAE